MLGHRRQLRRGAAALILFAAGCGGSGKGSGSADAGAGADAASGAVDAAWTGADAAPGGADAAPGENQAPIADAGLDLSVDAGSTVMLSGAGSSDPDGDVLSYSWRLASVPGGSNATLLNPETEGPSFVADRAGNYIIELVVDDGDLESEPDTVTVAAAATGNNLAPTADAGPDRQAVTGQTVVQLDGTGSSDPEGAALNYLWVRKTYPAGSTASLNTNDPATPTFTPDVNGDYVFRLQVNDGVTVSQIDEVTIVADSTDQIEIVSGSGQSGVVDTTLPQQIVAEVTNGLGMPVQSAYVQFEVIGGGGSVSPVYVLTDSLGRARTNLTLGQQAGVHTVRANCSACKTTASDTATATGTHAAPAQVVIQNPIPVSAGQAMQIHVSVLDAFGNLADSDSATQFTLQAQGGGSLAFGPATQGSIDSGAGTSTALVTVASGELIIELTDDTAELVGLVALDSQGNGLEYPGTPFDETSTTQALNCGGLNTFSFDVSAYGPPTTDAVVEVTAAADLNASFEVIDIYLESTAGTYYGETFDDVGGCTLSTDTVTVPLLDLETFAADGAIGLESQTDFSVSCNCASNEITVRLRMFAEAQAEFL